MTINMLRGMSQEAGRCKREVAVRALMCPFRLGKAVLLEWWCNVRFYCALFFNLVFLTK
jgi:hypothetical protein